ncbi:MAG TPA: tripartite tricarboxylate transporter substrate-binding protein [Pseudolabrys sp.]|nr:tripartite tricarboxylate transporter substrate-binding protein [Pseudolabrys sp.]
MTRLAGAAVALLALLTAVVTASAQNYPTRTITIIVPYPAGGPTDTTAREIGAALSARLKQNVVVEDVTGGGTTIATNKVAHAAPDGYTLLLHNLQISANVTLYKNLPFDTEKDLVPVMLVNKNPLILVGRKSLAPNNFSELVALMKQQPLKAAIAGFGSTNHLVTTLLAQEAKVSVDIIPYRGAAPAMTDILGGHVDLFFGTPQSIVPQAKAEKLKVYGITSKDKSAQMPAAESLVAALGPQFEVSFWQGLFAPAGTPQAVITTLNEALQEAVADPDLLRKWDAEGFEAFPKDQRSPQAASAFMHAEVARWGQVIRDNDIKVGQ